VEISQFDGAFGIVREFVEVIFLWFDHNLTGCLTIPLMFLSFSCVLHALVGRETNIYAADGRSYGNGERSIVLERKYEESPRSTNSALLQSASHGSSYSCSHLSDTLRVILAVLLAREA
jgi:hypothetical protein